MYVHRSDFTIMPSIVTNQETINRSAKPLANVHSTAQGMSALPTRRLAKELGKCMHGPQTHNEEWAELFHGDCVRVSGWHQSVYYIYHQPQKLQDYMGLTRQCY